MVQLSYQSVRFIKVSNNKLAIIYYLLITLILGYVIVISIVIEEGYQDYEEVSATSSVKMKGVGYSATQDKVFDSYDLVQPSLEANALFVATYYQVTRPQKRDICTGDAKASTDPSYPNEACTTDVDCVKDAYTYNGIKTGSCNTTAGFCLLKAWCPLEDQGSTESTTLDNIGNWSALVKLNAVFPRFEYLNNNVDDGILPGVNQFFLNDFLAMSQTNYDDVKTKGAIIFVNFEYECNLNRGADCSPTVNVTRIDTHPCTGGRGAFCGFNYRYIVADEAGDTRTLTKVAGLRFIFSVNGRAGKFSIVTLLTKLGAGLGLISVASIVCDFFLVHATQRKDKYALTKFADVDASRGTNPYIMPLNSQDSAQDNDDDF